MKYFAIVLFVCIANVFAAMQTTVWTVPSKLEASEADVGSIISVELWIENVNDFGGFQFGISYDSEFFHATNNVTYNSSFLPGTGRTKALDMVVKIENDNDPYGYLEFIFATAGSANGPNGKEKFATIDFEVVKGGNSIIKFDLLKLSDTVLKPIDCLIISPKELAFENAGDIASGEIAISSIESMKGFLFEIEYDPLKSQLIPSDIGTGTIFEKTSCDDDVAVFTKNEALESGKLAYCGLFCDVIGGAGQLLNFKLTSLSNEPDTLFVNCLSIFSEEQTTDVPAFILPTDIKTKLAGEEFSAYVVANDFEHLGAFKCDFSFDQDIAKIISVDVGDFLTSTGHIIDTANLSIDTYTPGSFTCVVPTEESTAVGPNAPGILLKITFETILADHDFSIINNSIVLYPDAVEMERDTNQIIPTKFELGQNYPNPFNAYTKIQYSLPRSEYVEIEICNMLGQIVKSLISKRQNAGRYEIDWNALDANGNLVGGGLYFVTFRAGSFVQTKKIIYLP